MSRRVVYLHIGAPKTGTTYIQDRLKRNVETLDAHGVTFPSRSKLADADLFHFRAALDLLGQDWGGVPGHAVGHWDLMMRRVRAGHPKVIISHEILAGARDDKIAKALNDLSDHEVHLVYSARDLGRQLPSAWQESIKTGRTWPFKRFLARVERGGTWFGRALDLPHVLDAWGAKLPPERVHVVTVPHERGPDGDLLFHRFCQAFGIDPSWVPLDSERANRSLGAAETQLIRRLNRRLDLGPRREATYDALILDMLAQRELVQRESDPVRLPLTAYDWVEKRAQTWIDFITERGIDVVGDIDDLRPRRPAEGTRWLDPDKVNPRKQLDAALDALVAMTREAAARPDPTLALGSKVRMRASRLLGR